MKTLLLFFPALLASILQAPAQAVEAKNSPLIQSYTDVLKVIPEEFSPRRASQWTEVKKAMMNVILKEALVDAQAKAKIHARVSEVARWPGLTLFWEIPNHEGYHIRLFAGFTEDWKARLSMLNVGDEVTVEGALSQAKFEKLWGNDTLTLCLDGSSFTKEPKKDPAPPKPPAAAPEVRITSAVYGTGTAFADVTRRVDALIHKPSLSFTVKPEWLEADPAYGSVKSLVVTYEFQGQRHILTATEGDEMSAERLKKATQK